MGSDNEIGILIVDDQEIARIGLRMVLEKHAHFKVRGEASDGQAAIAQTAAIHPNVILLDIGLPVMDGIEAAKHIKNKYPNVRIIMLTCRDDDENIFASLSAGADGYCLKERGSDEIGAAVRAVATGAVWLDPAIADRVLRHATHSVTLSDGIKPQCKFGLTPRELEVLALIVEGLTNLSIAEKLFISPQTVKSHVKNIMEKLAVSDRTQAAVKAIRQGCL